MSRDRASGPQRVLPANQPWALYGVAAARAIEVQALNRHAPGQLMRQAGLSVARLALALTPHAGRVWVAAGPGGNGGDGLHAAAELAARGRQVAVTLCADAGSLPADARAGFERAQAAGVVIADGWHDDDPDLAIDALLGIGANRAPDGRIAEAISRLNGLRAPRLAIDLPSGLSADTGTVLGATAVEATATLSLLTLKPGLFTAAGRDHAGTVWVDSLGAIIDPIVSRAAMLGSASDHAGASPPRRHADHKGSFGDVIVVGGAAGMTGAARLAAHGALASGAGRTFVSLLDGAAESGDDTRPEWLWRRAAWLPGHADLEHTTVVCGCGGGTAMHEALPALLSRSGRLVLDADALNAVAGDPALALLLHARASRGKVTVLTPHPLEAARLLDTSTAAIQQDRLLAARQLAERTGAIVVLKGSGTVIAAPGTTPVINSTGNARLATGGTGDVLAGWLGGLWTQSGSDMQAAFRCAVAAVWLHGAAADSSPGTAVRARDLVDAMRALDSAL